MKTLPFFVVFCSFACVLSAGELSQLQPISTKSHRITKDQLGCGNYVANFPSYNSDGRRYVTYVTFKQDGSRVESVVAQESLKVVLDKRQKVPVVETLSNGEKIIRMNSRAYKKAAPCLPSS